MTLRVTFGIDPGLSGAIATLIDGEPGPVFDMPVRKVGDWNEVAGDGLATYLRRVRSDYPGASFFACLEKVGARPTDGSTSAFRFGESSGVAKAVLQVLGIEYTLAIPRVWKRHFGLIKQPKDASRQLALRLYPAMAEPLKRKKDDGRAEALLLARWAEETGRA